MAAWAAVISIINKPTLVTMATMRNTTMVIMGEWEMLKLKLCQIPDQLYLLHHKETSLMNTHQTLQGSSSIQLITTLGEPLLVIICVEVPVQMTCRHF